jgi:hypothetical protein
MMDKKTENADRLALLRQAIEDGLASPPAGRSIEEIVEVGFARLKIAHSSSTRQRI